MAWVYLGIAGVFEVIWAFYMKQSDGFSRLVPTTITIVGMIISFIFLSMAMRVLPLGTSYVIWTGIGAIGSFILGIVFLGESADVVRILAALLIVTGLLMMYFASSN